MLDDVNGLWNQFVSLTSVTIDGVPVAGLDNPLTTPYRLQTVFIATAASHDNLLGDCVPNGSTVPTVAVGAFLMVKPLSVGNHTIQIHGTAGPPAPATPFLDKNVIYDITVKSKPCEDDCDGHESHTRKSKSCEDDCDGHESHTSR